ncbi:hypothetical protein [Kaistella sp.]|uniref:hypothetical protein n=1 Tax=Kaistella sp. TaxID=2782235 RepID=UPI002F94994B
MRSSTVSKSEVRNYVKEIIRGKIEKLEKFLDFTLEASREIKKTPKYDSIREEMQEEIYQMQKQLASLKDLQRNMTKVLNNSTQRVAIGSLVFTNKARFYISVSLGEFFYEGDRFYAISEESPMAKILFGKKAGDSFVLNNIAQTIECNVKLI